jgi:hypothetical protein
MPPVDHRRSCGPLERIREMHPDNSITLGCLRQAPCPVVVLPTDADRVQPVGAAAAG